MFHMEQLNAVSAASERWYNMIIKMNYPYTFIIISILLIIIIPQIAAIGKDGKTNEKNNTPRNEKSNRKD